MALSLPPLDPVPNPLGLPVNPPLPSDLPAKNINLSSIVPYVAPEWRPMVNGVYEWAVFHVGETIATIAAATAGGLFNALAGTSEITGEMLGKIEAATERGKLRVIKETRQRPLDVETLIQLLFRQQVTQDAVNQEGAYHGFSPERLKAIVETVKPILDKGSLEELYRRKVLDPADVQKGLRHLGYDGETINALLAIVEPPFDVGALAQLAAMRQADVEQLRDIGESQGIPGWQFDYLLELSRSFLSPQDYISLLRKGTISKGDFDKKMKSLRYTAEELLWFPDLFAYLHSPEVAAGLIRRQELKPEQGFDIAKQHGLSQDQFNQVVSLTRTFLTPFEYGQLFLREKLTEAQYKESLRRVGVQDADLEGSKELLNWLPAPQDLIRFAVREVYSPEQVTALDLDADFPEAILKDGKKVGVSEPILHQFWQAHWELPSPTQLFEMHHRTTTKRLDPTSEVVATVGGQPIYRVLSEESLKGALKANDIAPIWRDKFLEISNAPLTRVDVRRMYELGIISKDEVFTAYLDDGYSVENARRLADFVEADVADNYRGASKATMLTGYRRGVVSRSDLMAYLAAIKMPTQRALELVQAQDEMALVQFQTEQVDNVKQRYLKGFIAEKDLIGDIAKLGLRAEVAAMNLVDWRNEKKGQEKRITLPNLSKAYRLGAISRERFIAELKERNYREDEAEMLVAITDPLPEEP